MDADLQTATFVTLSKLVAAKSPHFLWNVKHIVEISWNNLHFCQLHSNRNSNIWSLEFSQEVAIYQKRGNVVSDHVDSSYIFTLKEKIMYALYFWLCWVLTAVWAFLYLQRAGAALQFWCRGFSLLWRLLSRAGSRACGFSSCLHMGSAAAPGL